MSCIDIKNRLVNSHEYTERNYLAPSTITRIMERRNFTQCKEAVKELMSEGKLCRDGEGYRAPSNKTAILAMPWRKRTDAELGIIA